MEIFSKYNRKNIQDRQIDTLVGLSKGMAADGKIDQLEAEVLYSWLIQNKDIKNPIILNLLDRVSVMLEDGVLDEDESAELLGLLQSVSGEKSEIGELAKPATLPLDDPAPNISFKNNSFLFTGTFAYGSRRVCQAAIEELGGCNASGVNKKLNYLILGSYVTDSWAHETFGRKIEKAIEYRSSGLPISIISEQHWLNSANL